MSYSILNPLFPQPAMLPGGTGYLTSQVTTITSGATTVTGFSGSTSQSQPQLVTFDVQGDDIRTFWEGSTPTATSGHVLQGGSAYTWAANQYNNAKFILSSGSTSSTICASPLNGG